VPRALDPRLERGLVLVFPHPDDEGFAAGGTAARFAAEGVPVTLLCGTLGQMGRRMGPPPRATRESLRDVRARELASACALLGIEHRTLGLFDKMVEFEDPGALAATIRAHLLDLDPSVVVTFHPDEAAHPDHAALARATRAAVASLGAARPRLLGAAVGERAGVRARLGPPDVDTDVRAYLDAKYASLRAHASQTDELFAPGDARPRGPRTERYVMGDVEGFYLLDAPAHPR
jgi:N-acetylglucosamine malate deacetylase 2